MKTLTDSSLARMQFTVNWTSDNVHHEEHYHVADVNMWRDIFPEPLRKKLLGSRQGDEITYSCSADDLIDRNHTSPVSLPLHHWQPPVINGSPVQPMAGRYYPQGFLKSVAGVYPQTLSPMRVIEANNSFLTVDLNHPLIGRQIDVTVKIEDISQSLKERGGRCSDRFFDILENGPGMQARITNSPITFDKEKAYLRSDPGDDRQFYTEPRMVSHIDSKASAHLASAIRRFLQPESKILDLMASVDSHLPDDVNLDVTGLGLNAKEMAANKDLSGYIIHDLNDTPALPFPDCSFDAVLCNLSIEYLTQPDAVLRETTRVLRSSGILLVSFSNRWFPPKVTKLWTELHEFERMGYVLQLCWPYFGNLQTISYRNWPRPTTDRHFPTMMTSDPLYIITGRTRS